MSLLDDIRARAARRKQRIVLPETGDERTLLAVPLIEAAGTADVVLVGEPDAVRRKAHALGVSMAGVDILDPRDAQFAAQAARAYLERTRSRGTTEHEARAIVSQGLYAGCLLVALGRADGVVSGATHTTADSVRAYLRCFGPGSSYLISCAK